MLVETTAYEPSTPLFDSARTAGCVLFDENKYLRSNAPRIVCRAVQKLFRKPLGYRRLNCELVEAAERTMPNLVVVVKGSHLNPGAVAEVKKKTGAYCVNFATDDPFNPRASTPDLVGAIPVYDLYACTKTAIIPDVLRAGAKRAEFIRFGYKPGLHYPESPATPEEWRRFSSDVAFVGGADADRTPLFESLADTVGGGLALYGGYWHRNARLRQYARGFVHGRGYRLAIGASKIAIGLVRKANRDGHSMRTFEIPACGAFLLAERTPEHQDLYREDEEAVFFNGAAELADKVRFYLSHQILRENIARNGLRRLHASGHTYQDRLSEIMAYAGGTA